MRMVGDADDFLLVDLSVGEIAVRTIAKHELRSAEL